MMPLEVQRLNLRIGEQSICDDLTLNVKPGEVWSVLGRNGVGKTTLLHTLAGLRDPVGGQIKFDGVTLDSLAAKTRGQKVSILFQQAQAPIATRAYDFVMSARHPWISRWGGPTRDDQDIVVESLSQMGLEALMHRDVGSLSGGERRRVKLPLRWHRTRRRFCSMSRSIIWIFTIRLTCFKAH